MTAGQSVDGVIWTPSAAAGIAVQVNGAAVEFETAADGMTRTAEVAAGTTAEDVKVFVGGVEEKAAIKGKEEKKMYPFRNVKTFLAPGPFRNRQ